VTDVSSCTIRAPSAMSSSTSGGDVKAQKIREALEKMKEAKMKKIYVKVSLPFILHLAFHINLK
jgi:hypothetical protein